MFFPAYVHKDEDSSYGLTFPDFEGCFAAADSLQDLPQAAQDAVQAHFEGETFAIPKATAPERWVGDERFEGGYWMLVEIDLSRINPKAIRINVSMSEQLVHEIDQFANAHQMSRSAFLAVASREKLAHA
ncbi:CopG family transcriptional regulator [Xylophilus rhododendri]|uniref:CopG family transcriptional regulator n=1 Tax=Xylophilus rhododendri TaxID=2697032 RepID=A0A857J231_9BURK|nr:type II toxin-antitoxin system HicB family antitoxin [Xylophilus rhododendri]QHI97677.1 CopG family transcriptional regulator [Xylophilus rhododendri]